MQHLTQDELKTLIQSVSNPRYQLMIKVGVLHGLRVSELVNLTKEDIRDGYITVNRLKGSNKTVQPFVSHPDPILDESKALQALYGELKAGQRLFPMTRFGVYKLIQRAGTKAGIPKHKLHPHVLKHTCAMLSIKKAGIENVRQYLGHKSISSTGAYLKVSDDAASKAFAGALV